MVELALALPILLILMVAGFDVARGFSTKLAVEAAAQRTTDYALAKRPESSDGTYLKAEAAAAAGVPTANVGVDIFLECDGVRQASFGSSCPPPQLAARHVVVVIRKNYTPTFDYAGLARLLGARLLPSVIEVTGDSAVRFQ